MADVLLVCDLETQSGSKERRDNYLHLLVTSSGQLVYDGLTKERLDYETSSEAGILPNLKLAQTKFIKLKTRLFYKQQKFNLFREESEGYAKLVTELTQNRPFDVEHMLQVIRSHPVSSVSHAHSVLMGSVTNYLWLKTRMFQLGSKSCIGHHP